MAQPRSRSRDSQRSSRRKQPLTAFCQVLPHSNLFRILVEEQHLRRARSRLDRIIFRSQRGPPPSGEKKANQRGGSNLMPFLTKLFGVTFSDEDRDPGREQADIEEITRRSLLMQANAATEQHRPLARGTHAKGVCVQAQFEIF